MAPVLRSRPARTDRYQPPDFRSPNSARDSNGANNGQSSARGRQRTNTATRGRTHGVNRSSSSRVLVPIRRPRSIQPPHDSPTRPDPHHGVIARSQTSPTGSLSRFPMPRLQIISRNSSSDSSVNEDTRPLPPLPRLQLISRNPSSDSSGGTVRRPRLPRLRLTTKPAHHRANDRAYRTSSSARTRSRSPGNQSMSSSSQLRRATRMYASNDPEVGFSTLSPGQVSTPMVPSEPEPSTSRSPTTSRPHRPVRGVMRASKRPMPSRVLVEPSESTISISSGGESDDNSGSVQFLESRQGLQQLNQVSRPRSETARGQPDGTSNQGDDVAAGSSSNTIRGGSSASTNREPVTDPSRVTTRSQTRNSLARAAVIQESTINSVFRPQPRYYSNGGAHPRLMSARRGRPFIGPRSVTDRGRDSPDDSELSRQLQLAIRTGGSPQSATRTGGPLRPRQLARRTGGPPGSGNGVPGAHRCKSEELPLFGSESTCTICLNQVKDLAVLVPCLHEFDNKCIDTWFKERRDCPVCRATISTIRHKFSSQDDYSEKTLPQPDWFPHEVVQLMADYRHGQQVARYHNIQLSITIARQ